MAARREQSEPMTIVLYDKLLQAVRPIVFLVGPRVKPIWDCDLVLAIMMPKLTTHLPFHYKTILWMNPNVSRRGIINLSHVVFGVPISSDLTR